MSSLDLSGLDKFSNFLKDPKAVEVANGTPMDLPLDAIDEDPDQPRKSFEADALAELAESIRARGVKQPISVRPTPGQPGRYIINHGARRFRASRLAERETIPAFVDADHGEIDQLAENIQRENLSTREIIDGIGQLLAGGKSKADIAKELGKSKAWVSKYAKLQNMPTALADALASGRCKDADALGVLLQCWEGSEAAVVALLAEGEGSVTKLDADRLRSQLDHAKRSEAKPGVEAGEGSKQATEAPATGVHDMNSAAAVDAEQAGGREMTTEPRADHSAGLVDEETQTDEASRGGPEAGGEMGQGDDKNDKARPAKEAPAKTKKPQVQVKVGRREAILMLGKPCDYGLVWVEYEDGSEELLDANRLKLVAITEGKKG